MSLLKPTGEKGLFLNKKEGPHGVFFSKNLTPNNGKNYLTVNVGSDGALTTIKLGQGEAATLKENRNGKGYNTILDGYRIFANAVSTQYGDAVAITVKDNEVKEEGEARAFNPAEEKSYSSNKSFKRS